jgi:hypothetical protein
LHWPLGALSFIFTHSSIHSFIYSLIYSSSHRIFTGYLCLFQAMSQAPGTVQIKLSWNGFEFHFPLPISCGFFCEAWNFLTQFQRAQSVLSTGPAHSKCSL